jgi:hypothetical protein
LPNAINWPGCKPRREAGGGSDVALIAPIKITGLSQFSRSLRQIDADLAKSLRLALNTASSVVIEHALPKVPRRTGRAAASLKAKSTRTQSRVSGGSSRAPYYPWLDFGGRVGRGHAVKRPFYKEGRYLYVAYREHHDEFEQVLESELQALVRRSGLALD